jgi:molecular chaperone GrpE
MRGLENPAGRAIFRAYRSFFQKTMSENNPQDEVQQAAADDNPADAATPLAESLAQAQGELAALQAKCNDLADQYLRAKADAENARRRAEEDVAKARKFGIESFAESLLPVADSLEAGLAVKEANTDQLREGAEATLRQLTAALERNKVVVINPAAAEVFNPHLHQAISMVPSEQAANTVVGVLQKGYSIADRVLRPALVTVAAPQ